MPSAAGSDPSKEPAPEVPPDFAQPAPAGGPVTVQVGPQGHVTITVLAVRRAGVA